MFTLSNGHHSHQQHGRRCAETGALCQTGLQGSEA